MGWFEDELEKKRKQIQNTIEDAGDVFSGRRAGATRDARQGGGQSSPQTYTPTGTNPTETIPAIAPAQISTQQPFNPQQQNRNIYEPPPVQQETQRALPANEAMAGLQAQYYGFRNKMPEYIRRQEQLAGSQIRQELGDTEKNIQSQAIQRGGLSGLLGGRTQLLKKQAAVTAAGKYAQARMLAAQAAQDLEFRMGQQLERADLETQGMSEEQKSRYLDLWRRQGESEQQAMGSLLGGIGQGVGYYLGNRKK